MRHVVLLRFRWRDSDTIVSVIVIQECDVDWAKDREIAIFPFQIEGETQNGHCNLSTLSNNWLETPGKCKCELTIPKQIQLLIASTRNGLRLHRPSNCTALW